MELEILPSLTPVDNTFSTILLCIPILNQALEKLVQQGFWTIPTPFDRRFSISPTQVATTPNNPPVSRRRICNYNGDNGVIGDSIANRLPARSKGTRHRLNRISIAHRLPFRHKISKTKHRAGNRSQT